jgi:hypothetical protein
MKKIYAFLPLLALPVMMLFMANNSGSPGGRTGSTGDSGNDCTGCHSGSAQTASDWITSSIPGEGYIGGETYLLNLTGVHASAGKFGFELTAEDEAGNKVGTFAITNATETKLVNTGQAVTHTSSGTTPSGNSKEWEFEWTAPEGSTGNITFFACVNAANGDGGTGGDEVFLTSKQISPDVTNVAGIENGFGFYPNPTTGIINFNPSGVEAGAEVLIYNSSGQMVYGFTTGSETMLINLSHLPKGVYFFKAESEGMYPQKLVIR